MAESSEKHPSSAAETFAELVRLALAAGNQPKVEKITSPFALAGQTLGNLFSLDASSISEKLEASAKAISGGQLEGVEGTLATQAATLNALFHHLTQYSTKERRTMEDFSGYMKLALKAQAQSAHALEVLGNMKQGPRVVVTRQLNAANQQVVNNAPAESAMPVHSVAPSESSRPAPSAKSLAYRHRRINGRKEQPEPSILNQNAALDTRSPSEAASGHHGEQAMDESHGTADPRRKAAEQPQRQ